MELRHKKVVNMPVMDEYTATKLLQVEMKNNTLPYMPIGFNKFK